MEHFPSNAAHCRLYKRYQHMVSTENYYCLPKLFNKWSETEWWPLGFKSSTKNSNNFNGFLRHYKIHTKLFYKHIKQTTLYDNSKLGMLHILNKVTIDFKISQHLFAYSYRMSVYACVPVCWLSRISSERTPVSSGCPQLKEGRYTEKYDGTCACSVCASALWPTVYHNRL